MTDEQQLTAQGHRNMKWVDNKLYSLRPEDGRIYLYKGLTLTTAESWERFETLALALTALAKIVPKPEPNNFGFGMWGTY